ncbi:hypothetical protein A6A08_19150 [Nocardiopsis sp. TSRI0078]|uniref:ROK family protein n=1 Tax=unclassified Nocardiopsis TaxID=2649073 RepID=UPI00095F5070|nr:ROK family protein [Nocardiopsis sp. TSRI0078]OKI22389.1 hypothetical protein A6A08_19150 [Nocardiopsis sp. TSRI0078]
MTAAGAPAARHGTAGGVTVFDVGGTHMRRAEWSREHGLGDVTVEPAPSMLLNPGEPVDALRKRLLDALGDAVPARSEPRVAGVSLGAALDHRTGTVYGSAPLWGDETEPFDLLGELRRRRPDVSWHVVNDVTAALLHLAGSPRCAGLRKVALMTVSSGIACRVLDRVRDVVPTDACGLQGEVGHLPATARLRGRPVELDCDCGGPGHVAAYASGPGIRRMAEVLRERTGEEWARSRLGTAMAGGRGFEEAFHTALEEGDAIAGELLTAVTAPVADVLRTALALDPELDLVAFTGGVAVHLADHYRDALLDHLSRDGLYLTSDREPSWVLDRVVVCRPGEANGLEGAGHAALSARAAGPLREHRAVVREAAGPIVRTRTTPEPGPGELLLEPLTVGVCGTDIQMLRGLRDDPAPVIGHEGVARVVAAGPGTDSRLRPGTTVTVNPTHPDDPGFLLGHNVDGLLSERVLVPGTAVRAGLVVPLAEGPEDELAALVEPLAVVGYSLGALARYRPRTLVVFGDGTVGHLAVRAAGHLLGTGVRTVHVHHTGTGLEWSESAPHRADVRLRAYGTGTAPSDVARPAGTVAAVVATPRDATASCLETALSWVGDGGVVDVVGGLPADTRIPSLPDTDLAGLRAANRAGVPRPPRVASLTTVSGDRVRVFGHRGVSNDHLVEAAAELRRRPERYRDLVTHSTDLDGAVGIMSELARGSRYVDGGRVVKLAVRVSDRAERRDP